MRFNGQNKKFRDPRYFLHEEYQATNFLRKLSGGQQDTSTSTASPSGETPSGNLPGISPAPSVGVQPSASNITTASKGIVISTGNQNSDNYAIFFGGMPSSQWGAATLSRNLAGKLKGKNIIYSDWDSPPDSKRQVSIQAVTQAASQKLGKNVNITMLFGWSRGGKNVLEAIATNPEIPFKAVADPTSAERLQANQIDPNKVVMSLSPGKNGNLALNAESLFKQANATIYYNAPRTQHWDSVPFLIDKIIDKIP